MNNREEKGREGEPQTKEEERMGFYIEVQFYYLQNNREEESVEIGGLTTPTYPPKPHLTFSIVFLREFF